MKTNPFPLLFALLILGGTVPAMGQISTPESREATLAKAAAFQVMEVGSANARFAAAADPFYTTEAGDAAPAANGGTVALVRTAAPSDRVILRALAEKIQPSGVMQFGPDTLLLFGERRVKVGDLISVPHGGSNYHVEVVEADARTFTLRLNNELISKRIR